MFNEDFDTRTFDILEVALARLSIEAGEEHD